MALTDVNDTSERVVDE